MNIGLSKDKAVPRSITGSGLFLELLRPLLVVTGKLEIDGNIPPREPVLDVVLLELDPDSLEDDLTPLFIPEE